VAETPLQLPPKAADPYFASSADGAPKFHQASQRLACAAGRLYSSQGTRIGDNRNRK
jgi:hypothetical protein